MIALVIGHNKRSKGAFSNYVGMSEYNYWKEVSNKVKLELGSMVDVFERQPHQYYSTEMKEVVEKLHKKKYDYVLELHFNAAGSEQAQGCECLAYSKSVKGQELAKIFNSLVSARLNIKNRGIINITSSKDRGGYGIMRCKYPYVLIEPFFCTNEKAIGFTTDKLTEILIEFIKG